MEESDQRVGKIERKEQKDGGKNNPNEMMMERTMKDNVSTSAVAPNARDLSIGTR